MTDEEAIRPPPYEVYDAVVHAVATVTPKMKRVTIAAPMLRKLRDRIAAQAFKVFVPSSTARAGRMYTVREYDRAAGLLTADFVLHGPSGAASDWAERATAGDRLRISDVHPRIGFDVGAPRRRLFLFGDETAIPAIASIVAMLPGTVEAEAFIEVAGLDERQVLPAAGPARIHWLSRDGRAAGTVDLLPAAAGSLDLARLAGGHVWVAAEARAVKSIRAAMRDKGLPPSALHTAVYWRHGLSEDRARE